MFKSGSGAGPGFGLGPGFPGWWPGSGLGAGQVHVQDWGGAKQKQVMGLV